MRKETILKEMRSFRHQTFIKSLPFMKAMHQDFSKSIAILWHLRESPPKVSPSPQLVQKLKNLCRQKLKDIRRQILKAFRRQKFKDHCRQILKDLRHQKFKGLRRQKFKGLRQQKFKDHCRQILKDHCRQKDRALQKINKTGCQNLSIFFFHG
jgi:hypothetical protein